MHAIYMRRWVREGKRRANSPPLIYYIFIFSAYLLIDANLTIDWGEKLFYYFLFCIFKLSQNSSKKIIVKLFKNQNFPIKLFFFGTTTKTIRFCIKLRFQKQSQVTSTIPRLESGSKFDNKI